MEVNLLRKGHASQRFVYPTMMGTNCDLLRLNGRFVLDHFGESVLCFELVQFGITQHGLVGFPLKILGRESKSPQLRGLRGV